jgi:hypothetical protein
MVVIASLVDDAITVVIDAITQSFWQGAIFPSVGKVEARGAVASEQDDTLPRSVVGEGMNVTSRWAGGRKALCPVSPVPLPGVRKAN